MEQTGWNTILLITIVTQHFKDKKQENANKEWGLLEDEFHNQKDFSFICLITIFQKSYFAPFKQAKFKINTRLNQNSSYKLSKSSKRTVPDYLPPPSSQEV